MSGSSAGGLWACPFVSLSAADRPLEQVVTEQPCIMKLDVEGYEPTVLRGAAQLLARFPPKAILTEYTPGVQASAARCPRGPPECLQSACRVPAECLQSASTVLAECSQSPARACDCR